MDVTEAKEQGYSLGYDIASNMEIPETIVNLDVEPNEYECPACGERYFDRTLHELQHERTVFICDGHEGCGTKFSIAIDNRSGLLDMFSAIAHEIEQNARQFTPFEFIAHELNNTPYPDCMHDENEYCDRCNRYQHEELWQSFDNGISEGIQDALNERLGIKETK